VGCPISVIISYMIG